MTSTRFMNAEEMRKYKESINTLHTTRAAPSFSMEDTLQTHTLEDSLLQLRTTHLSIHYKPTINKVVTVSARSLDLLNYIIAEHLDAGYTLLGTIDYDGQRATMVKRITNVQLS